MFPRGIASARGRLAPLCRAAAFAAALLGARGARATGFTDIGQDITQRAETAVKIDGYYRVRAESLSNLDLDRGVTPSGQPLFPIPSSETGQVLYGADMRLRTDVAIYAPGQTLAVKLRLDSLDNVAWGSTTQGSYAAAQTQQSPASPIRVKRAYGMVLTPVGVLSAGRMGNHWGLGMLANGGDCADCDSGDSADRIMFATPLAGLVWAAAYDLSATGPVRSRKDGVRMLDVEPTDNVQTVTFAVLKFHDDAARERRRRAGLTSVEGGAYVSHRWQQNDIPASYLPTARPVGIDAAQVVPRGYTATALDGWLRVAAPSLRLEVEAAYLTARVDQVSLLPGVRLRDPVLSKQVGLAIETEAGSPDGPVGAGVDAGYASGDPAPGFGAFPDPNGKAAKPGDLDGPQANVPRDGRVDNFRFSPDYRIDRILFREIIGTVTDAVYARPHARLRLAEGATGSLTAQLAAVASWAVEAASTPGGKSPLGLELDPTLAYVSRDGFALALDHGILFPWSGLDNPVTKQQAKPAQVLRARLFFRFLPMRRALALPFVLLCSCGDNQTRLPRDHAAYVAPAPEPLACVPNLDGKIEASELQAALGVSVTYLVSAAGETRGVDLLGKPAEGGMRLWDWSADYAGDRAAKIEASSLEGKWYEASFPGGQFVAPYDAGGSIESVYAQDETALYLLGLASRDEGGPGGKTLLVYSQPVALYRFPLEAGAKWVSVGETKNATLQGLPYAGKDVYEVEVDAEGEMRLPDLTFTQALRVRQKVTVQPVAGMAVTTRQVSFLFECFGEVARATARRDETEDNFTTAAEVRRLGLE